MLTGLPWEDSDVGVAAVVEGTLELLKNRCGVVVADQFQASGLPAFLTTGLHRRRPTINATVQESTELVREGRAAMMGAVRQEILSGVQLEAQYETVRGYLRAFPDIGLEAEDYIPHSTNAGSPGGQPKTPRLG